ncbi:MAG: histone H1 [Bacteroidota bacterium]
MANRYSDLKAQLESVERDLEQFYDKGNKAAGTRARKGLQDLRNLCQEVRQQIQAIKKGEA